jgi:hypothetical protein
VLGIAWLGSKIPSDDMENLPPSAEQFQTILLWGSVIAVPVWQFARRRRWVSAAALLGILAVSSLISVVVPNVKTAEEEYPQVKAETSPAKIRIRQPAEMTGSRNANPWLDASPYVNLNVPINALGVASGTMVMVDAMKLTTDSPQDSRWSHGWKYQHVELWPEDELKSLSYEVGRKEYEKLRTKPLNLHIELALSEYQEADVRILPVPAGKFSDETLGICRLDPWQSSSIQCLKPFHAPGLMATFDPQKSPCTGYENAYSVQEDAVSHGWEYANHDSFPDADVTPIAEYSVWFRPASLLTRPDAKPQQRTKSLVLCSGSEIRLARPELKRRVRIQLELPDVRLQDLVVGFDLRMSHLGSLN